MAAIESDRRAAGARLATAGALVFAWAMCGRFSFTNPDEALRRLFGYDGPALDIAPRYNIAPTQLCTVVRPSISGKRAIAQLRWGLLPSWAKDRKIAASLINARCETLAEKPAFRGAFAKRRCLIPADGFYEWQGEGKAKRPYRISLAGCRAFAFAGLWERWRDPAAPAGVAPNDSFAIVTTEAAPAIAAIHHRMPAIVPPEHFARWLDAENNPPAAVQPLLVPYAGDDLVAMAVQDRVNNARNDDPACLERAG